MWLSGDLVKDFLNYFYYYRLIFYYYVLLQITLPPQLGIFLEVFWQNTFWKTFEGSLLLVNCKRLRHRCFPLWTTRVKAVYTTEKTVLLFRIISQIDRKIPMIESYILTLQARRPAILLKKTSSDMFSRKLDEVFQKTFSQSTSQRTTSLIANTG